MTTPARHVSVLLDEVIRLLDPQEGETWIDATTGAGGHAQAIAQRLGSTGKLIALDQDAGMLELAKVRFEGLPVVRMQANFDQLAAVLESQTLTRVDGLLADLGFCSDQLDDPMRGLSFQREGPLDMRLDPSAGEPASAVVHRLGERELADMFWQLGEEPDTLRRVARRIVERRKETRIETTSQLADLVRSCIRRERHQKIDPATKVFQVLRIYVNDELGSLERLLSQLPKVIRPGGRVGIMSFHSLEDRQVKRAFLQGEIWEPLTRKPTMASEAETEANPRSRSAKLRTARRK